MKIGTILKENNLTLIGVSDEFDTSEAMFLEKMFDKCLKKELKFCIKEFKPLSSRLSSENETFPVLVIGENVEHLDLNEIEYIQKKLDCENSWSLNKLNLYSNKSIIAETRFSIGYKHKNPVLNDYKEELFDKVFTSNQSLFKILKIGDILFIFPNRQLLYFNENEIKRAEKDSDYHWLIKKTLVNKTSFLNELRERQKSLREYTNNLLRTFSKNNLGEFVILGFTEFLNNGFYIGFIKEEMADYYRKNLLLPFTLTDGRISSEDNVHFVKPEINFLSNSELEENIVIKNNYINRRNIEIEKFNKVIKLIKENGLYSGYGLNANNLKEWENKEGDLVWETYVNTNSNNSGWYSLSDLNDWVDGKGKYYN